ncbi:MAG: hypothetical protein IPJ84_12595 [Bdellovibrionales bacterium]|nr:hypothetical protein [Bdellovibrionales bacterium]
MKLNSMILAAATLTVLAGPQAKACGGNDFLVLLPMMITSGPTGTTFVERLCHRDELLNLQEAAVAYRMSGEMSPVLQSSIDAVQKEQNLSAETIIDRLVSAKLGAE